MKAILLGIVLFFFLYIGFILVVSIFFCLAKKTGILSSGKSYLIPRIGISMMLNIACIGYGYYLLEIKSGSRCFDGSVEHAIGKYWFKFPAKMAGYSEIPNLNKDEFLHLKVLYPKMKAKCDNIPYVTWPQLSKKQIKINIISTDIALSFEKILDRRLYQRPWFKPSDIEIYNQNLKRVQYSNASPPIDIFLGMEDGNIAWLAECASRMPNPICKANITSYPNLNIGYVFHMSYVEDWREVDRKVKELIQDIITGVEDD